MYKLKIIFKFRLNFYKGYIKNQLSVAEDSRIKIMIYRHK